MTVTVKKLGGSVAVVIPKGVAREMQLTDGVPLEITASDDAIVLRKRGRRPRRALAGIVRQIKPASYRRRGSLVRDDRPVGKELW